MGIRGPRSVVELSTARSSKNDKRRDPSQPPKHLRPETQAWWELAIATRDFEEHEMRVLLVACETLDRREQAREALKKHGLTFTEPAATQSGEQIVRSDTILSKISKYRGAEQVMIKKLMGCPGWLKLSEDRTSFIFDPEKAEIVRKIFEASISGLGGYTIAKQLDAKKVPAFGPSPKWDQSTIHNMLRNRATIGEHQPKRIQNGKRVPYGDPISNFYPAVIEESLFLAAQVARQENLASGRGRKGRLITNLFRGIPTCAYCASPVKFKSKSNIKSLICSTVIENRGCYRMAWSYKDFENSFLEFVKNRASDRMIEQQEREALKELVSHIRALSGSDVYDARMGIARSLKATVSELKIASAGPTPVAGKPDARIRLDRAGRYFLVRFRSGPVQTGFPADK